MNILSAEKINMSYSEKVLLNDISLFIENNDKIGVIGVNGAGKSTLLKILAGIETPLSGKVSLNNGARVSYLPQNPEFDSTKAILDQVLIWASENSTDEIFDYEAKTILTKLGITDFDKPVNLLSGGQKKRVAIAAALLSPVELLILDEPTNHLDYEMVTWLEEMLKKYQGALLIITHDRYFLDRVTNRIIEIDRGNLYTYKANYSTFLQLKTEREQMDLASDRKRHAILKKELAWMQRGARARSTKAKGRIEAFHNMSEIEDVSVNDSLSLSSISTRLGKKIIEIENISKSFGDLTLITNFSHTLDRNSRIGIIGKNGTGKSTLLNIICGKISPDSGSIDCGDTVKIGYFSQESEEMDINLRVIDYIKNIAEYIQTVDGELSASQMLEKFLFPSDTQWNSIGRLSGGERRRLFLLSILMDSPNILLLDEPTNDLDIQTLSILEDYLEGFSGAVITVSHDRYFLDKVVNRIFTPTETGEIKQYLGGYSDFLDAKNSEDSAIITKKPEEKINNKQNLSQKLKFSYNEQREFDTIDDDIEKLENKISLLSNDINKETSNFEKLNELLLKKAQLETELDEKIERWTYLTTLSEKIANQ